MRVTFLCIVFLAWVISPQGYASAGHGDTVADFSIERLDGSTFRLSDYLGKKPVSIVFWATWCSKCQAEIPALKALHQKYGEAVELLAINVNVNDSRKRVDRYINKHQIDYPVAFDETRQLSKRFNVVGTPTQLIIDVNGVVQYRAAKTPEDIDEHLAALKTLR